ncbi:MAG: tetratricopeptide repeat protein, partial [Gammaproteobacteria bacterium]|nr:tetratricopeptide repeat protein [Gammaproteobacteria bacterium]
MIRRFTILLLFTAGLTACATGGSKGTLGELEKRQADLGEVVLNDSLERAAQSYRRYLEETSESALTPEAMRRLADLQIEQEYGVLGGRSGPREMAAPDTARVSEASDLNEKVAVSAGTDESDQAFEQRATQRQQLLSANSEADRPLNLASGEAVPDGPREAIAMYQRILQTYPNYERNDQVLYQMSRAYDEIGEPDKAMLVMDRLVAEYPHSRYLDEIFFRRGEYYFVRKNYRDAEDAYAAIIRMGDTSSYYELALYKMGWSLYKQQFYEEALHRYLAMLDHRQALGYDFDQVDEENEEHRVADTFRVISLSFSNLGGPDVVDEYFDERGQRRYADKIYSNLGEFYFSKLRYDDAASVYRSYIESNPFHKVSPHFSMRVVEIFAEAGFPKLVVESKKEFADRYSLRADYWQHFDVDESPQVVGFLKTNLTDLANHYHALYQDDSLVDEQTANFAEAERWYRDFLVSFPVDDDSPQINYQLADLLLEDEKFGEAAA